MYSYQIYVFEPVNNDVYGTCNLQRRCVRSTRARDTLNKYGMSNVAIFDLFHLHWIIFHLYAIIFHLYWIIVHLHAIIFHLHWIIFIYMRYFSFALDNFHLHAIIFICMR